MWSGHRGNSMHMSKVVNRFYITDGGKPCVRDTHR